MSDETIEVSGPFYNVFEALGLPKPDVQQAKTIAQLALRDALDARGMSQREAAAKLGLLQPALARALKADSDGVSWDQLFKLWAGLGGRVQVSFVDAAGGVGVIEAEAPGMLLAQRLAPAKERPQAKPKARRVAERASGITAREA